VIEERTGVAEAACTSQEFEILKQAIEALPGRCREIMSLQKMQGFSNQEIALRLGVSVNTVNAQLVIGLARCRRYLLARGVLRGGRP
jgi:RNA polymerase sigma-70 factor (ECF subfamily)